MDPATAATMGTFSALSAAANRRMQEREAAADRENQRRAQLMSALGQLGQGVGSTGMQ